MKIIAFAASSSRQSINKKLAIYATSLVPQHSTEILDLNDFELPLFSVDREQELGQPALAQQFLDKLDSADAIVISLAEHNGNFSAAYKNLFDWCTRIKPKVYLDKKMVLLATSPGGRGGQTVLEIAVNSIPRFGAKLVARLSVPNFFDVFDAESNQIIDESIMANLSEAMLALE